MLLYQLVRLALFAAAVCTFYWGVSEPLMVLERFFLWETKASLIDIVRSLWMSADWPLAILVGLFSLALPTLKLIYLFLALCLPKAARKIPLVSVLSSISRWSMLDVLVVAVVIVATKTTGLAKATAQAGLWYFAAAIVLMAVLTVMVQRRVRK